MKKEKIETKEVFIESELCEAGITSSTLIGDLEIMKTNYYCKGKNLKECIYGIEELKKISSKKYPLEKKEDYL